MHACTEAGFSPAAGDTHTHTGDTHKTRWPHPCKTSMQNTHARAHTHTLTYTHRYGYMWRLLRWIGAYAAGTMLPVDTAAHHIEQLEARYINGENISFENWNRKKVGTPREEALKASNRLQ
eukprot:scaffold49043_cov22-Tisochrysis_lutea.AAC.1